MTPEQEANGDNLGIVFDLLDSTGMLSVPIRIASMSLNICFLELLEEFLWGSKTS